MMRSAILLVGLLGCTSGSSDVLTIFPKTTLFTGIDPAGGGATYRVTIAAYAGHHVTWQSSDLAVATVTGNDTLGTVTAVAAGNATITVTANNVVRTVPLTVQPYSASDLAAGATAYQTYACAKSGCHDATGPDVTPSGCGKHTDPQLLGAVTSGQNPENAGPLSIGAAEHSFPIAAGTPESTGIIAYMRSLPPGTPIQDP